LQKGNWKAPTGRQFRETELRLLQQRCHNNSSTRAAAAVRAAAAIIAIERHNMPLRIDVLQYTICAMQCFGLSFYLFFFCTMIAELLAPSFWDVKDFGYHNILH
jgi:hypothetical protein